MTLDQGLTMMAPMVVPIGSDKTVNISWVMQVVGPAVACEMSRAEEMAPHPRWVSSWFL